MSEQLIGDELYYEGFHIATLHPDQVPASAMDRFRHQYRDAHASYRRHQPSLAPAVHPRPKKGRRK